MTTGQASRAVQPDVEGWTERDGVRIGYQVFGDGETTLVLMPAWSIVHSRFWKAQLGFLARHYRVVTFDGRGNGRSGRPVQPAAYADEEYAADTIAVMDATATDRAVLVALSSGATWAVHVAAGHPERILGIFAMSPACEFQGLGPSGEEDSWETRSQDTEGWAKYNRHYWLEGGYPDFVSFFFGQMFTEAHSTKQIEDCVGWGLETSPETLVATAVGRNQRVALEPLCAKVACPVLVVHGTDDAICPPQIGERLAELTGGDLLVMEGVGHGPMARHPVRVNLMIREFVDRIRPHVGRLTWTSPPRRRRRALYLSSPIGLGHARRDLAIVQELKRLQPDLEVDWLAQHPVTVALEAAGERIHPASAWLANESAHVEHEAGEHDLHAFQAIRRMDEILVHNFMVFQEVVEQREL